MIKKISKYVSTHSQITIIVSVFLLILVNPYYWETPLRDFFNFLIPGFNFAFRYSYNKEEPNKFENILQESVIC